MSKRKANSPNENKNPALSADIKNLIDQKYILAEILKRIKERSDAAEKNIGTAMGRIDKLEETTKDILRRFKHHLKECDQGNKSHGDHVNFEALASKFVRNLEKRIISLEESVADTNKRICVSDEEKRSLIEKVRVLQKEAQLTKKACMEIIHFELTKNKTSKGDCPGVLNNYFEEIRYLNGNKGVNSSEGPQEKKQKKQRRGTLH